jgi:hypothetical protein
MAQAAVSAPAGPAEPRPCHPGRASVRPRAAFALIELPLVLSILALAAIVICGLIAAFTGWNGWLWCIITLAAMPITAFLLAATDHDWRRPGRPRPLLIAALATAASSWMYLLPRLPPAADPVFVLVAAALGLLIALLAAVCLWSRGRTWMDVAILAVALVPVVHAATVFISIVPDPD